jgi:predicted dehydrogenase
VYVATPHPRHEEQVLAAVAAGKHVLCEKPLGLDAASAERMIAAARARGVFLMEGFMYRSHPLLRAVIERVRAGVIGTPRFLRSQFGFRTDYDPRSRLFAPELGGGAVFDVGGYPVSLARLCAGLARGGELDEPASLRGSGLLSPAGADELATASLRFASGFVAEVACATRYDLGTESVLFGDAGRIVLADPWLPAGGRQGLDASFWVHRDGSEPERVSVRAELSTFALEAELVLHTLPKLEAAWPAMSHADSLGNARALDAWREQLRG